LTQWVNDYERINMRVGTAFAFARTQEELSNRQARLAQSQDQLSSGLRIQKPSDDPYAAAQVERARSLQVKIEIDRRALNFSNSMLASIEGALGNGGDVLQEIRTQINGAGNGVVNMNDRYSIAQQLTQLRSELLGVANRGDGGGGYLFGGQGSRLPPFMDGLPVQFVPQSGSQSNGSSFAGALAIDGAAAFTSVPTSLPGQGPISIFDVIDSAIDKLKDNSITSSALTSALQPVTAGIDQGLDGLLRQRSMVGERMRALDNHAEFLDDSELRSKAYGAELSEVDMAEAISAFTNQKTALEALMQTYAQISDLSLFNYIR
jgi:flagellar hook-associated protein 3 FlgL